MSVLLKSSQPCPVCPGKRSYAIWDDNTYCFRCGYKNRRSFVIREQQTDTKLKWTGKLPEDSIWDISNIPKKYIAYLRKYFKDPPYQVKYSPSLDRLIFPVWYNGELKCYQARAVDREPKWLTCSPDYEWGKKHPYFSQGVDSKNWVIVEDIVSAMIVGKVYPTISILGTTINQKLCNFLLRHGSKFIIWLDGDDTGVKASKKLETYLSKGATIKKVVSVTSDPKCFSSEMIEGLIQGWEMS